MFEYDTKGVLLSTGTREAFGQESGKCFKCQAREPDARAQPAGQLKTTRGSCWPDPRVTRFWRVMT